jgi:hypothetical protein
VTRRVPFQTWLRLLEGRLGIDREGRTVWVWVLPPGLGLVTALMVLFMPGVSTDMGLFGSVALAVFGLLAVTVIASIYLISFDKDHNQEASDDDLPASAHDHLRREADRAAKQGGGKGR